MWAIRSFGWLELGFRSAYFHDALARTGWVGQPTVSADLPWISVWEATPQPAGPLLVLADDPRLGSLTGHETIEAVEIERLD